MTHRFWWPILGILLAAADFSAAGEQFTGLTTNLVRCKTPAAPRPALRAERGKREREAVRSGWYSAVVADFNGDGWCDFAWAVPFPVNSQMESYYLDELLVLGGAKGWRPPFRGNQPTRYELDPEIWPSFRVSLTAIAFVQSSAGGAPFVLGLVDGYALGKTWSPSGCGQYSSVHQWDNIADGFKRIDGALREAVLNYYYSHVEKPCR